MCKTREEMKDTLFAYLPSGMTMKNVNFEMEIDEIADYIDELEAKLTEKSKQRDISELSADELVMEFERRGIEIGFMN